MSWEVGAVSCELGAVSCEPGCELTCGRTGENWIFGFFRVQWENWTLSMVRPEQASVASSSSVVGLGSSEWRPVALGVGLMGLLAAVFAGIGLYARSGWYVGEYNGEVAVFKGRPSGVLWFNPTVEEVMGLSILDLPEPQRKAVVDVIVVASLSEGRDLVERLSSPDD